jgi:hypothetical protein
MGINMNVDLDAFEFAMDLVSNFSFDNEAYVDSENGKIYFSGDGVEEELPDDINENDKYLQIPTKQDLDLGRSLALKFTSLEMPDELDKVYSIFRSSGAYSRFKSLLEALDLTEKWYEFENKAVRHAVVEWCVEHSIPHERT